MLVDVAVIFDQLGPANVSRDNAALGSAEAVISMTVDARYGHSRQHRGLVADNGADLVATRTRALEVDLLAALRCVIEFRHSACRPADRYGHG
jgi:hypothetical protein